MGFFWRLCGDRIGHDPYCWEKIAALKKKRGEYAAYLSALEKNGESQISLTDPDSRAMAAHTKVGVGYNAQIAVDAKHKMIVEQAVSNDVLDMGLLQQTAEPARQILDVEKIDVVADKGYFRTEDIAACEKAGLMPHVPKPQRGPAVASGFFRKDEFRYDAAQDAYICPGGHELKPIRQGWLRNMRKVDYANASACRDCSLRPRCTNNYRAVSRLENEDALDSYGRADSGEARSYRPAPRDRRASFWHDQAMDESGCLSHAWPRKSPRRIQSDGARLQSATGAEHPWRRNNDGRGPGLKGGAIPARLDHANDARALTTASCAESQESRQKQAPVVYHRSTRAVSTQSA